MDITSKPKPIFPGPKPPAIPSAPPAPKLPTPSAKPLAPMIASKTPHPMAVVPKALPSAKPIAQQKPLLPTTAPPTAPASAPASVAIHTMKDDLTSLRNPPRPMPTPAAKPAALTPSAGPKAATPSLPIAPLKPQGGKSVVIPIGSPKKGLKRILTAVIIILIAFLAAGAAAWYFLFNTTSNQITPAEAPKSIQEILPANATAITEYQLNDDSKIKISQLFSQPSASQPTFDSLLAGDPRLVLEYADVKELYYVQLSGDARPYILSPETSSLAALFEHSSASQTTTQNGWRIAHPVNVASFASALSQGSMAGKQPSPLTSFTTSYGVRIYVSSEALASAVAQASGLPTSVVGQKSVTLKSDISISGSNVMLFDGLASTGLAQPATILKADPSLLALVPSDAQFVYAGNDMGADIQSWSSEPLLIAAEIISQPQVKQILTGLNGLPYAFYRQASAFDIQTPRFGLIIKLTPELVKSLNADKAGLETALFALRPLITGTAASLPSLPLFADGTYSEIPLRYVNISGPSQAIDYAISDPYLIIATSKDGMFATLDVLAKKANGLLEQNASLAPAKDSIQANSTAQSTLIMSAKDSRILSHALPGFVAAQNAVITIIASALDGETQSIKGLLAF